MFPHTCHCVANVEREILIERCRTHNTYQEMLTHNRLFGSESKQDQRETEKSKPEFQRR